MRISDDRQRNFPGSPPADDRPLSFLFLSPSHYLQLTNTGLDNIQSHRLTTQFQIYNLVFNRAAPSPARRVDTLETPGQPTDSELLVGQPILAAAGFLRNREISAATD